WPGGDGIDVRVPGLPSSSPIVQPSSERTVDLTIPFGAATSPFQKGFTLSAADFSPAPSSTTSQLNAAGHSSFSPVLQANLEAFTTGSKSYNIKAAALDTSDDSSVNYDTIVIFDVNQGIQPEPFPLPSTGPAYIKPSAAISASFYLEGHSNKGGI